MAYRDYILHNFWWKLLSVLLASLIWLTIETAFQKDQFLRETPVVTSSRRLLPSVPVTLMTSSLNTNQYTVEPALVEVELSGTAAELSKLQERQVKAFVDVSEARGEWKFRRMVQTTAPEGLKIEQVRPISVSLERVASPK